MSSIGSRNKISKKVSSSPSKPQKIRGGKSGSTSVHTPTVLLGVQK